jgi:hypothetical protein
MAEYVMPARRWGDEEAAPLAPPIVLVSSRDGAPVPKVGRSCNALVAAADAGGWDVRQTFALAHVPDRWYGNGNLAMAAHNLASVAVRLARGAVRAFAVWTRVDDEGWTLDCTYLAGRKVGYRDLVREVKTC